MSKTRAIIFSMIAAINLNAESKTKQTQIQIYNDYAQILEKNTIKGVGKDLSIKKYDIPTQIIDDSIYLKSSDIDIKEISHNKNNIDFKNLLKERLMRKIRFFKVEEEGSQKSIIQGTLISIDPIIIKDTGDKLYTFIEEKDIIIEEIPPHFYAKDNIEIKYNSKKPENEYEINYLTRGISCSPVYNILMSEGLAEVKGYMLIENATQKSFTNTTVRCISGSFKEVSNRQKPPMEMLYAKSTARQLNTQYKEIKNDEFQVYELPYKTNISQNSKKLNVFIDKNGVKTKEENKLTLMQSPYAKEGIKERFERYLVVENDEKNKLGENFQEGSVRVYKNIDGVNVYNGGSKIEFTPKSENLEVLLGKNNSLFIEEDIKLSSTKKRTESLKYENISYNESLIGKEYKITNNGQKEQSFKLELKSIPYAEIDVLSINCSSDIDKCKSKKEFNGVEITGVVKKEATVKIKYKLITGKSTKTKS